MAAENVPEEGALTLDSSQAELINWINGRHIRKDEYEVRFSQSFRNEISLQYFRSLQFEYCSKKPWQFVDLLAEDGLERTINVKGVDNSCMSINWALCENKISSLLFTAWWELVPKTVSEAIEKLQIYGQCNLLVVNLEKGKKVFNVNKCEIALNAEEPMPLGSVFKLFVLGAVIESIKEKSISWNDQVEIKDSLKSLPPGETSDVPDGECCSVRALVERMISESDNTATDHLIDLIGRRNVENVQHQLGVRNPNANRPFLTTREFFALKLGDSETLRNFENADESMRRTILSELGPWSHEEMMDKTKKWNVPVAVSLVEWFATPADVCRTLLSLWSDSDARHILSLDPGVPDRFQRWASIGFKGGSEIGVGSVAWIAEDMEGNLRLVAGGVQSDDVLSGGVPDWTLSVLRDY